MNLHKRPIPQPRWGVARKLPFGIAMLAILGLADQNLGWAQETPQKPAPRLLAYYPMEDDHDGTTADAVGGPPARLRGGTQLVPGKYGLAAEFGGEGDWIDTARSIVDTTRSWSVAVWVWLAEGYAEGIRTAVSQDGDLHSVFYLQYCHTRGGSAPDRLCLAKWKTPQGDATLGIHSKARPEANRWIHLAAVQDMEAKKFRLYVDGELADEQSYESAGGAFEWAGKGNAAIGRGQYDGRHVDTYVGRVDEVYFFEGVLSAAEVVRVRDDQFLAQPPQRGTAAAPVADATLVLNLQSPGSSISPLLCGYNLEHTRHAVWQGLSAELLANRKFAGVATAYRGKAPEARGQPGADGVAAHWHSLGQPQGHFSMDGPAFAGLPSQRIAVEPQGRSGGIVQAGLPLQRGVEYQARFWVRADQPQRLSVQVSDASGGLIQAKRTWNVTPGDWQEKTARFNAPRTDTNASLALVLEGPGEISVGAASLMPAHHFHGLRPDVLALLRQTGAKLLRWPGGNFTLDYRWQDGLLPVDRRPPIKISCAETQPFADNWDFHEIGTDEFMALCHELRMEPALTVNLHPGLGSPQDAAAWVEYCNGSVQTPGGRTRAQRGHPQPYGVKFWFVGNEIWGDWMGAAHSTASVYAQRLVEYSAAMRKADPSVELIASGLLDAPAWDRTLLTEAGASFHLLSEHNYAPEGGAHAPLPAAHEFTRLLRFVSGGLHPLLEAAHRTTREFAPPEKKIGIVLDEWNVWHDWFVRPPQVEWHVGPIDACYAAVTLNLLCREADTLDLRFAAFFQPVQEGVVRVRPFTAELTPLGQVFELYQAHQDGRRLPLQMSPGLGLDACASLSRDGRKAHVTLVNRRAIPEASASLTVLGDQRLREATVTSLSAQDLTPEVPLLLRKDLLTAQDGHSFHIPLPRYGVVLIEIPVEPSR